MAFFVKFWGTRGSIPTPGHHTRRYGGNTSCVELSINGTLFVCDGGTGLRELGMDLLQRGNSPLTGHLLFSHAHWDHIQGFPFFTPLYLPANTFYVYGTSRGDTRLYRLLSGQMQSDYFPVDFADLRSKILPGNLDDGEAVIDGTRVRCLEQQHPGKSFAFAFEALGKKVVYATDNELDLTLPNTEEALKNLAARRMIPERYVAFAREADLLIADGQYTDAEYPTKIGWGHARCTTLVDLAIQAGVKQLAVFHHDPMQSDDDMELKIAACQERAQRFGSSLQIFGAREGVELRID
jgi:phosphoribosyl 1,2-cyclic phosphodiesterase